MASTYCDYVNISIVGTCHVLRFINYARNVWDRAVTLLPRVDVLWSKYIHMEEMLGNIPGARQVYERWMKWEPDHQPWASYINVRFDAWLCTTTALPTATVEVCHAHNTSPQFELRYKEHDRAREIFERYVLCIPSVQAWVKYAKFEYSVGEVALARRCYERALEDLAEEETSMELYIKFADFEQMVKEPERARAIYKCVGLYGISAFSSCSAAPIPIQVCARPPAKGPGVAGVQQVPGL